MYNHKCTKETNFFSLQTTASLNNSKFVSKNEKKGEFRLHYHMVQPLDLEF